MVPSEHRIMGNSGTQEKNRREVERGSNTGSDSLTLTNSGTKAERLQGVTVAVKVQRRGDTFHAQIGRGKGAFKACSTSAARWAARRAAAKVFNAAEDRVEVTALQSGSEPVNPDYATSFVAALKKEGA